MLAELLGSATRAKVLTVLLEPPRRAMHLRELIRHCDAGSSGVQREVARLERIGLVRSERDEAGRRMISPAEGHPLLAGVEKLVAAESAAADGAASVAVTTKSVAARIHPRLRHRLPRIVEACRSVGVERAVLFGSATDVDGAEVPNDLDVLVRLGGPVEGRAARYFTLRTALEEASGVSVDLVEDEAITNPYLRDAVEHTGVVIAEAA